MLALLCYLVYWPYETWPIGANGYSAHLLYLEPDSGHRIKVQGYVSILKVVPVSKYLLKTKPQLLSIDLIAVCKVLKKLS